MGNYIFEDGEFDFIYINKSNVYNKHITLDLSPFFMCQEQINEVVNCFFTIKLKGINWRKNKVWLEIGLVIY